MNYIPVSEDEKQEMLKTIGVRDASELFDVIPERARIGGLDLPEGLSEQRLVRKLEAAARRNVTLKDHASYRGAGVYEHFIPAAVGEIVARSEFATAYTPYQPEASQGTLQTVFEYQSMIAALTGMEVANASLYDGASATAEAALMALRVTGRKKILVSEAVHPEYRAVLATYLQGGGFVVETVPFDRGTGTSGAAACDDDTAAFIVQSPNFFGTVEDIAALGAPAREAGALFVTVVNPLSLGLLIPPGEAGADIAVGEGQVLGSPAGLGGFTFGFFACTMKLARKIPGRVVGRTTDAAGRRGFVLTLQSREQHIRREKATSNICTNSALNALAGCVYLAGWGPDGFRRLAEANMRLSRYAFERVTRLPGFAPAFNDAVFFNEFMVCTDRDIPSLQRTLLDEGILGPFEPARFYPDQKGRLLFCVTETKSKDDIDRLVDTLGRR